MKEEPRVLRQASAQELEHQQTRWLTDGEACGRMMVVIMINFTNTTSDKLSVF